MSIWPLIIVMRILEFIIMLMILNVAMIAVRHGNSVCLLFSFSTLIAVVFEFADRLIKRIPD